MKVLNLNNRFEGYYISVKGYMSIKIVYTISTQ